jgi:hypothetical protein
MFSALRKWWAFGEVDAVAVYRARVIAPLILVTIIVGSVYFATLPHAKQSGWVFLVFWTVGAIVIGFRRRRAAIFSQDVFLYRPAFGKPLRIPISGIRCATPVDWGSHEAYPVPTVRIELIVGGSVDVPLGVSKAADCIRRIDECVKERSLAE